MDVHCGALDHHPPQALGEGAQGGDEDVMDAAEPEWNLASGGFCPGDAGVLCPRGAGFHLAAGY